ncbi:MAG: HAD family hydrolase [Promethearchaeota archaeon]
MFLLHAMRDFLVFDLGETLINFNQQGVWHQNLQEKVIPQMYSALQAFSSIESQVLNLNFEHFCEVVYSKIALKTQKHISMVTRVENFLKIFNLPLKNSIIRSQLEVFLKNLKQNATLYPDVHQFLENLKDLGYTLAIWSNTPWQSPGWIFHDILRSFDLHHYFTDLYFSGDYEIQKPDPRTLQIVAQNSGQKKENMVYIGNAEVDIITGSHFGISTVWINREERTLDPDCPQPSHEITHLDELMEILPLD